MASTHAVIVRFTYRLDTLDALFALEDRLVEAIEGTGAGEYDGHDIAADLADGALYIYGPDADALCATVLPILRDVPFMKGATCIRRFGDASDPGAKEIKSVV